MENNIKYIEEMQKRDTAIFKKMAEESRNITENENKGLIEMYRAYLWNKNTIDIPLEQLENLEEIIEIVQRLHTAYQLGKPKN